MKKNKMMRLASSLLVAVLLTTSVISGTFAKYVTSGEASDSARVAKWGVVVTVTGNDAFAKEYAGTDGTTVECTDSKVVAPGTSGSFGGFAIAGTPEVDVMINLTATKLNDVVLAHGEYDDPTGLGTTEKFNVQNDYYPVVYTLKKDGNPQYIGNLQGLVELLNTNFNSVKVEANTPLENAFGGYTIEWEWPFELTEGTPEEKLLRDQCDTYLGNQAVSSTLTTGLKIEVTVTQID